MAELRALRMQGCKRSELTNAHAPVRRVEISARSLSIILSVRQKDYELILRIAGRGQADVAPEVDLRSRAGCDPCLLLK